MIIYFKPENLFCHCSDWEEPLPTGYFPQPICAFHCRLRGRLYWGSGFLFIIFAYIEVLFFPIFPYSYISLYWGCFSWNISKPTSDKQNLGGARKQWFRGSLVREPGHPGWIQAPCHLCKEWGLSLPTLSKWFGKSTWPHVCARICLETHLKASSLSGPDNCLRWWSWGERPSHWFQCRCRR